MENSTNDRPSLDISAQLRGKKLVIVGGTGFLGKVFWAFLLSRYPEVGRLYLVVRPKGGRTAEARFWADVAPNDVMRALREEHGEGYEDFLREKVVPVAGDVVQPFCGLDAALRDELRGEVAAVVNASGVVEFDPPLDEALEVNAFGVRNLVALAKDLGDVPLLHTSTCYVAGSRQGHIEERDPREFPFPRADELALEHWDPEREIAECLDVVDQARSRGSDAFRQSRFVDEAKHNLVERGEPARGRVLDAEIEKVKRRFIEGQLADMGMERAKFWGFPNTYTYTKAIGEQIVASSGLRFTIGRPAIIESTVSYPFPGWNEGINTSAPLIYILREGGLQIPAAENLLDVIPCDMVASGMVMSLAELIEGTAPAVYQYGSSDSNPCTMRRFFELTGLYKRRYWQKSGRGGALAGAVQSRFEGAMLSKEQFERFGPQAIARGARGLARLVRRAAVGQAAPVLAPAAKLIADFAEQQRRVGDVLGQFVPFTAEYSYVFRCDHTRAALARLGERDRARMCWEPERLDWREWFLEVHVPGLEKWVFPELEKKLERKVRAPARHETLTALLDEMAERHELAVALQRAETDGLSRISYLGWRERASAAAARLQALGVRKGERVLLAGKNHPAWAIDFFGILLAGATPVPLDAAVDAGVAANLRRASGARVFVADREVRERVRPELADDVAWVDLVEASQSGAPHAPVEVTPEDLAALIYTSGTTGTPKGVMLTHANLTALVASLAPLFPLGKGDRVLSVLPLHHTFELTCGLLLPLSRGARIVYLDELDAERLSASLKEGKITAMVGVPALWELLERRITARIAERGPLATRLFDVAVEINRGLGKNFGLDAGRLLFGPVHEGLGGHLRFLVSGGAALPESVHAKFAGLGLHLAEGYGLTEASPVLTVAPGGPSAQPGNVGKPIPGVEISIASPDASGVGEVLARGPNVMLGYSDDEEATRRTIDEEGWLHTGDLGKLDRKGRLVIVGRAKDVIVAANGENVYPDDVEARLGTIDGIKELAIVGVMSPRGGERVACVAVAEEREQGKRALDAALQKLPASMRPAMVTVIETPLPRTATRKVKRAEVRRLIERVAPLSERPPRLDATAAADGLDGAARMVRAAVGVIARREPGSLGPGLSLRADLAFDSLMLLELLVALEAQTGAHLDAERLSACLTLGDAEELVRESSAARRLSRTATIEHEAEESLELPPVLREAAMHWLGRAQMGFYESVLDTKVTGRAFIPHNESTLVAANHASHLDMGLVKYALGSYGKDLVSLAAADYFFEGGRFRRAYFENLTNLVALSRSGSLRQSLRQAGELLERGKTVLIFPEGTRSSDGEIHEFKPAVGHLALVHQKDILPVHLGGTYQALPKGATVLRRRGVTARIGPPLRVADLRRLTEGMTGSEASRAVAGLVERAVVALSRGEVLDISRLASLDDGSAADDRSMARVFEELERRFVAGTVDEPVSFYFSLGEDERWSIQVTRERCEVTPGKLSGSADCVLKTSPTMFTRIVREAYTPSPAEFISGTVKSNNIGLLTTFQKVFQLSSAS
ncbi:MAG: AMP-binding protein [Sorangiineae bacterium]|nr:AMP-binding protein [Polyangiaceae bacterium]MEB2321027.1 AMP-binding protein [Sorangiineae bacterium]